MVWGPSGFCFGHRPAVAFSELLLLILVLLLFAPLFRDKLLLLLLEASYLFVWCLMLVLFRSCHSSIYRWMRQNCCCVMFPVVRCRRYVPLDLPCCSWLALISLLWGWFRLHVLSKLSRWLKQLCRYGVWSFEVLLPSLIFCSLRRLVTLFRLHSTSFGSEYGQDREIFMSRLFPGLHSFVFALLFACLICIVVRVLLY